MKALVVIVLCLVSALGVAQITILNEFISGAPGGLSLQSGNSEIIGINGSGGGTSGALLHDATGAELLNDATGATLLNDNP